MFYRFSLVIICSALTFSSCWAWDPIGDITHPDRIVRNVARETSNAVNDIPNVPRNVGREINNAGQTIDRWRLEGQAQAGAPVLENWFIQSRNTAASGGTFRIPPQIRQALAGFYDDDVLNRARYKIGDAGVVNLANLSISYGDANAVTLIDVIVFANQAGASDPVLWAHELKHVQQFRDWGTRDFSIRYLRSWNSVENDAYSAQNAFAQRLAAQPQPQWVQPSQPQWGQPNMAAVGNFCSTPFGRFGPGPLNPVGAPCNVPTPNGPVFGQVTQ